MQTTYWKNLDFSFPGSVPVSLTEQKKSSIFVFFFFRRVMATSTRDETSTKVRCLRSTWVSKVFTSVIERR